MPFDGCRSGAPLGAEVAMPELLGDQPRLDDAQHPDRAADRQREPQDDMDPDRRLEAEFDPEGERSDDRAEDQDDEDCRPVTGVLLREIESADVTARGDVQKTREEGAAP